MSILFDAFIFYLLADFYWQLMLSHALLLSSHGTKRHNNMKYCITYYKNGKAVKVRFATIEAASKAAQDIFECLGVIVGIESIA